MVPEKERGSEGLLFLISYREGCPKWSSRSGRGRNCKPEFCTGHGWPSLLISSLPEFAKAEESMCHEEHLEASSIVGEVDSSAMDHDT